MPAIVSVNYFHDPEFEDILRCQLEEFMESYEGQWMIRLSGSQDKAIGELKVETPDGRREWVTTLYKEDHSRPINKIMIELRKILEKNL